MTFRSLTRRSFVKSAAVGLASAPTIISSAVFAKPGAPAPSDRVAIGFIGCGRQTQKFNIPLFMRTPGVQPIAVCDVDQWRLTEAVNNIKREYASGKAKGAAGEVATYADYRELLARDDVDAVCVATPDHWHIPMALDVLQSGKDVALEKPIARTIRDGQRLIEAVQKHRRVFRVDSEMRSAAPAHRAAMLVSNGYIGKVRRVDVGVPIVDRVSPPQPPTDVPPELDYDRWQGNAPRRPYAQQRVHPRHSFERPGWFSLMDYADGVITNWGAHLNDAALWAIGKQRTGPVEVAATGKFLPPPSVYDVLAEFDVTYRFADGLPYRFHTGDTYLRIEGEDGWVWADFTTFKAEPKSLETVQFKASDILAPLKSEKQDFIDCVRSRRETMEPADVGHRVNSLGLIGLISAYLGQSLQWDPTAEQFVNNDAANHWLDKPIRQRPPA